MQLQVSGQHISIGASLQEYVKEKVPALVTKYFSEAPSGHVYFSKQNRDIHCEIIVNEGTGRHVIIKSDCVSDDSYIAFDNALNKLAKQLQKYKSKINDHSKRLKLSEAAEEAVKYVISSTHHDEEEFNVDNPAIVAEKSIPIMSLSVGEAVMKMDLENLPALMFKNAKNGRVNVVYYRKDGNISWLDSEK